MGLAFVVEAIDRVPDGAVESADIGKDVVGEQMLFEVSPASLNFIQLGGGFQQPFEGELRALGEGARGRLSTVYRPVVENRAQGPGMLGGWLQRQPKWRRWWWRRKGEGANAN